MVVLVAGRRVSGELAGQLQVRVSLGLVVSQVVYGNRLVWVVFVSTHVRTGCVRVMFSQLIRVIGRVSVGIFFTTLNLTHTNTTRGHDLPGLVRSKTPSHSPL